MLVITIGYPTPLKNITLVSWDDEIPLEKCSKPPTSDVSLVSYLGIHFEVSMQGAGFQHLKGAPAWGFI